MIANPLNYFSPSMNPTGRLILRLLLPAAAGAFMFCSSSAAPPVVTPHIIGTIPHDSAAFTQGIFFDHGRLYESDGLYGSSRICILDAQSGALIKAVPLDPRVFAEGCAKMGSDIVQISWREETAFTWSVAGLSPGPTRIYSGEGWGLTSDGRHFYMSDGSDTIFVRSPGFTLQKKIPVRLAGRPVKNLNELEMVKGVLFANVWYSDSILEINPGSGRVTKIIDCSELVRREAATSSDDVLNGIAYNDETGKFYLTGKKWKTIFIVDIAR
jgi:glutamine cyclotransferase